MRIKFLPILFWSLITGSIFAGCGQDHPGNSSATVQLPPKAKQAKRPVVIEVIIPENVKFNENEALSDAKGLKEIKADINQWKNHITIFAMVPDATELANYVKKVWHGTYDSIRVYDHPFYKFDRSRCGDTTTSKEWTNILLTANLVADPKLQQEYLNYHATQFEKWPEVSNGFCNAQFQQLLVFKNGRQLMLIISIPKGADLDKLNPLTSKNNPRVDDWNKLMSKYQEGIPGTKPGESWVFLKPVGSMK